VFLSACTVSACTALRPASDPVRDASVDNADTGRDAFELDAPGLDAPQPDAPQPDAYTDDAFTPTDAGPRCPVDPSTRPERLVPAGTEITSATTWDCAHNWVLEGAVVVTGATLTVEASTVVEVADGAFVLVARDARIEAVEPPQLRSSSPRGRARRREASGAASCCWAPRERGSRRPPASARP
jgi:hypothetical protein